jgi:hypothetical protein
MDHRCPDRDGADAPRGLDQALGDHVRVVSAIM